MLEEVLLVFRVLASLVFVSGLCAGAYLLRNYERFFGPNPDLPSENSSARAYSKLQIFVVLAHVLVGSAAFALMLH